ncbi:MAG: hypothetical protein AOA66_1186 [Candidatus Bathyarchaeota archaeon BA2]|nr:MAG: hypothetical protein AOA66_1186 [Candidatus Bathyarchaeota archaeon BA2]
MAKKLKKGAIFLSYFEGAVVVGCIAHETKAKIPATKANPQPIQREAETPGTL